MALSKQVANMELSEESSSQQASSWGQQNHRVGVINFEPDFKPSVENIEDFLSQSKDIVKGRYVAVLQFGQTNGLWHLHIGCTAVAVAVSVFNDGCSSLMAILRMMDIIPGQFCRSYCEETDVFRIKNAQRQAMLASKELRQARRRRRLGLNEQEADREGHPYQGGGY